MAKLKTDSPLCRRIVRAFFDFLDSVEPASGVDLEGLEVARECLSEAFKLDSSSIDDQIEPGLLVNLFRSLGANELPSRLPASADAPSSSFDRKNAAAAANHSEAPKTQVEDWTRETPFTMGPSRDELFGQFFAALEKIRFFKNMPDGNEDPLQLDKATKIFHDALNEMEKTGCQSYDRNSLAETLKSQGNRAMQLKLYSDAIELYSCAIGLCENNAVYYCNRAAAYTHIHKYTEAIRDCLKSIEINQKYSKAYSRLGLAYYAQGIYRDAIDKGFKKALQLDPNNESIKENIRVAEQKLKEEQQRSEYNTNTSSSCHDNFNGQFTGGSTNHGVPPPFPSIPFDINAIPGDFTNMFTNMAANMQHPQGSQGENTRAGGSDEPERRAGGNINLNIGENIPEELGGALRSMMEMFSGTTRQGTTQERSQSN